MIDTGEILEWTEWDYADMSRLPPAVLFAQEHIARENLQQLAREEGVSIGEIHFEIGRIPHTAGGLKYRAWAIVEGLDPWAGWEE